LSESWKESALVRAVRLAVLIGVFVALAIGNAGTVRAGENPQNVSLQLRQGPQNIAAVLTWTGIRDTTASYEVYRRTPHDLSVQKASVYATVPASARKPDGTVEFVDPQPTSLPDKPCYSIGAKVGAAAPDSATPDLCLPTLPGPAMVRLQVVSNLGPDANSWYLTGTNFAPGSDVVFREGASRATACAEGTPLGAAQATSDGYAFLLLRIELPQGRHTVAACQPGWLPEQLQEPPTVVLPTTQAGVGLGYPLSARTGIAEVDRVLEAIQKGPDSMIALLHPHEATTNAGETVIGVPAWQCGEFVSRETLSQQATEAMPPTSLLYAVYRIDPGRAQWQLFKGADYAIVLANRGPRDPRGSVATVSLEGIVGFGWACQALPSFFVRANAGFVIPPPTEPTGFTLPGPAPFAPGAGNTLVLRQRAPLLPIILTASASIALASFWFARARGWWRWRRERLHD